MHLTSHNPTPSSMLPLPPARRANGKPFPHAPTLLATRLQMELLLSSRPASGSVDLREAAGILLNDLGATLEVFRLAGEQALCTVLCGENCERGTHENNRAHGCGQPASIAGRLEDCLAALGTEAWLEAVNADAVERTAGTPGGLLVLTQFWEHARSIAYSCWLLAADHEDVCPEEAYLAGLLHEAAALPGLLGWSPAQFGAPGARWTPPALADLAAYFRLPAYLACLLTTSGSATRWKPLLDAAHACSRPCAMLA